MSAKKTKAKAKKSSAAKKVPKTTSKKAPKKAQKAVKPSSTKKASKKASKQAAKKAKPAPKKSTKRAASKTTPTAKAMPTKKTATKKVSVDASTAHQAFASLGEARKARSTAIAKTAYGEPSAAPNAYGVEGAAMSRMRTHGLRSESEILHIDDQELRPFRFVDHGSGNGSLCLGGPLDGDEMPMPSSFRVSGLSGDGYCWDALSSSAMRLHEPTMVGRIAFDSEADMFCASGTRAELLRLAGWLRAALRDDGAMMDLIAGIDPDELDE
jgi:hypothetical protein